MSVKALANLVCESSVRSSSNILTRELDRNLNDLKNGVLAFGPPPSATSSSTQTAGDSKKLGTFVRELSQFLQINEEQSKKILSTYLAGDFRGTKDSLKKLVSESRYRKPLLRDIWYFYRAERLYLLQVLKEVLSHARSTEHKHADAFADAFDKLRAGDALKKSLFDQLRHVLTENPPTRDNLGKNFSEDIVLSWTHVNLRELVELLQLLLLYYYNSDEDDEQEKNSWAADFLHLIKLFQTHGFSRKSAKSEVLSELLEAIGCLQSLLLVQLIDLPRLTAGSKAGVWSKALEVDRLIAGLGNKPDHGPVMLAWMLAHFLNDEDFSRFRNLGERAVQMNVLKYIDRALNNDVIVGNFAVASVVNSVAFAVSSVLVSSFDPARMNLDDHLHALMKTILKDKRIAAAFWKLGFDSGLGLIFESKLARFPAQMTESVELCISLSEASPESANEVLHCLERLSTFAELVELVPQRDLLHKSGGVQFELCAARMNHSLQIPKGTKVTSDGKFYFFEVDFDAIKFMLGEAEQLIRQASLGASNVRKETLENVILITQLFQVLLKNGSAGFQSLAHLVSKTCFLLVEKCVRLPVPPVPLLANCLKSLSILAQQRPHSVWERLSETGIFPFLAGENDVNPGMVGALLAQHECVRGLYPLTTAFLDLLLACVTDDLALTRLVRPSVIFIIQDIFPSYQHWRFEIVKDKEIFGQKLLLVIRRVVLMSKGNPLKALAIQSLMSPAPNQTLLTIAATGDRIIQSMYESQATADGGAAVELSKCVYLSLDILNILLHKTGLDNLISLKKVLCSPPQASRPHFLLTISHYLYHLQSCDLPLAAVKLMSTVATILPMSLLACLGSDAEAIREIFVHRLEAQTEDILLKIAIVKFFSSCVESQPGLIQLLLGVKSDVSVVVRAAPLSDKESVDNESVDLVGESGCLSTVLDLLKEMAGKEDEQEQTSYTLHVALVDFIYSLWSNQRVVALSFLKRQPKFWETLTKPLLQPYTASKAKLISCILSIISSEIYTYKGQVDSLLIGVLEKLSDDKASHMSEWCLLKATSEVDTFMEAEDSYIDDPLGELEDEEKNESAFLLSSWKAFLVVLSRDQPIAVSPKTCQNIVGNLIKAIRDQLSSGKPDVRMTTALSETCLVLMQRWQTKCAEKMELFVVDQANVLTEASLVFENLNSRSLCAIVAMAATALKFSAFMVEKEEDVLMTWLRPVVDLVEKSLNVDGDKSASTTMADHRQVLTICLLQNLLSRFSSPGSWLHILHERSMVQLLLSTVHHNVRTRANPELTRDCLGLIIQIARTPTGCDSMIGGADLSQLLWLPLSSFQSTELKDGWLPVFLLAIELISALQLVGKQRSLENSISAVSLLQDHLTSFLLSLRDGVQKQQLDLTLATANFVTGLMKYYKQWQLQHSSSLVHFYCVLCSLLHRSVCLLIRPSLLTVLIGQKAQKEKDSFIADASDDHRRARRRMSSAEYFDGSIDITSPETTSVQNRLLDVISCCLSALLSLSPDLLSLVTDDIVDVAAFECLLHVGFSIPSFEQDESGGLSYGTIIQICNLCIRSMTRSFDRSPSPSKSGTKPESGTLDRNRLILVLEKSMTLVLSQGLLFVADHRIQPRDKQLLRRELGAELGSITENVRRHVQRGGKSHQIESGTSSRLSKSDENFMKFVTTIVQKAFK